MGFGEYLRQKRNENNLSQRDLAAKSGISNAEISRIETGDRLKPAPLALKAFAPHLGVPYEVLLKEAGYMEEVIDHPGYVENVYRDEKGHLMDIVSRAKEMYDKDMKWANLAYRVSKSDLSDTELEIIRGQTELLLEQFLKNKKK